MAINSFITKNIPNHSKKAYHSLIHYIYISLDIIIVSKVRKEKYLNE